MSNYLIDCETCGFSYPPKKYDNHDCEASQAIRRVRELHKKVTYGNAGVFCEACIQEYEYPCPTIKALDGEQ